MDDALHGGSSHPATLTIGGFAPRRPLIASVILVVTLVVIGVPTWAANFEPLSVDDTALGVRPLDTVVHEVDATSPRGEDFTQFTIRVAQNGTFSFLFWMHNDSPFAVTITDVGYHDVGTGPRVVGARMGPASGTEEPSTTLPYTIAPHEYAAVSVTERLFGCLASAGSYGLGPVPVSFRFLGIVSRRTTLYPPLTIQVTAPPGHCGP